MSFTQIEYLSVGANRQSGGADCSSRSGNVAFGADVNVAIWHPHDSICRGTQALLRGHVEKVTAVKYFPTGTEAEDVLISGSADGELRIWITSPPCGPPKCLASFKAHTAAVNTIAVVNGSPIFVSGGADSSIKLWKLENASIIPVHTIELKPRYIPLTVVLGLFQDEDGSDCLFLAAGGTRNTVQIFVLRDLSLTPEHDLQATLSGHEGWIRSLALRVHDDEFLLASASHDKYVRIWRFRNAKTTSTKSVEGQQSSEKTLTRKVETICSAKSKYIITFEALLLGHEDWVYSAAWCPRSAELKLLTASADGTLAIWEPDLSSGIWVSSSRLGEISGQKGATTATGSAGGFWTGIWTQDVQAVACIGRTGSWRLWQYDKALHFWDAKPATGGHTEPVNSIAWSKGGHYLLSTGSDQTTRLHAEWRRSQKRTWHEFARPQIHGYDLNCITSTSSQKFVSGADEKLLRVFEEPKLVASMLRRLCGIEENHEKELPPSATMPVLGLSNKSADTDPVSGVHQNGIESGSNRFDASGGVIHMLDINEPPTEDILARHTLWPEQEKLYGHGYEISEVASNDGTLIATACKASSTDHAVIRLYDMKDWHEVKPLLSAHSLTVTRLSFSLSPDAYLLSVGRDRQWTVFEGNEKSLHLWQVFQTFPKAHSRMILDAAWSPVGGYTFFATAGRDKAIKIWLLDDTNPQAKFTCHATVTRPTPVTAIDFSCNWDEDLACLAAGEEYGALSFHVFHLGDNLRLLKSLEVEKEFCPTKAITRLSWRPGFADGEGSQLAVASADGSVTIMRIKWEDECKEVTKVSHHNRHSNSHCSDLAKPLTLRPCGRCVRRCHAKCS